MLVSGKGSLRMVRNSLSLRTKKEQNSSATSQATHEVAWKDPTAVLPGAKGIGTSTTPGVNPARTQRLSTRW